MYELLMTIVLNSLHRPKTPSKHFGSPLKACMQDIKRSLKEKGAKPSKTIRTEV